MTATGPGNATVEGVVTARKCECCGHHEIGIVTGRGEYFQLEPGMRVILKDRTAPAEDERRG